MDEAVLRVVVQDDGAKGQRQSPGAAAPPGGSPSSPAGAAAGKPAEQQQAKVFDPVAEAAKMRKLETAREAVRTEYKRLYGETLADAKKRQALELKGGSKVGEEFDALAGIVKTVSYRIGGAFGTLIGSVADIALALNRARVGVEAGTLASAAASAANVANAVKAVQAAVPEGTTVPWTHAPLTMSPPPKPVQAAEPIPLPATLREEAIAKAKITKAATFRLPKDEAIPAEVKAAHDARLRNRSATLWNQPVRLVPPEPFVPGGIPLAGNEPPKPADVPFVGVGATPPPRTVPQPIPLAEPIQPAPKPEFIGPPLPPNFVGVPQAAAPKPAQAAAPKPAGVEPQPAAASSAPVQLAAAGAAAPEAAPKGGDSGAVGATASLPVIGAVIAGVLVAIKTTVDTTTQAFAAIGEATTGMVSAEHNTGKAIEGFGAGLKKTGETIGFLMPPLWLLGSVAGEAAGQFGKLMQVIDANVAKFGEYNPQIALASAMADVRQIMGDLRRSQEVAPQLSRYINAQANLQQKYEDMKVRLLEQILPAVTGGVKVVEKFLPAIEVLAKIAIATSPLINILELIDSFIADNVENAGDATREALAGYLAPGTVGQLGMQTPNL